MISPRFKNRFAIRVFTEYTNDEGIRCKNIQENIHIVFDVYIQKSE